MVSLKLEFPDTETRLYCWSSTSYK